MKKLTNTILIFSTCALTFLTACGKTDKLDSIKQAKKMIFYTNANFPPLEYMDGEKIVGVDVELANEIAKDIGVEAEIYDTEFDGIISSQASGKGDAAIAGISASDEKREHVDFSIPYLTSTQYMVMLKNDNIQYLEDLENKKIGTMLGYSSQNFMENEIKNGVLKKEGKEEKKLFLSNNTEDALLELLSKKIDVVIVDEIVAKKLTSNNEKLKCEIIKYKNGTFAPIEEFSVAISKNNPKLLESINSTILKLQKENKIENWLEKHRG